MCPIHFLLTTILCPLSHNSFVTCLAYLVFAVLVAAVAWRCWDQLLLPSLSSVSLPSRKLGSESLMSWSHTLPLPELSQVERPRTTPIANTPDSFQVFSSFQEVPQDDWLAVAPSHQIFLQPAYLKAMEKAPTHNTESRYAVLYRDNRPTGIATFQLLDIPLRELGESVDPKYIQRFLRWTRSLHTTQQGEPAIRLLFCGNAMLSDSCCMAHTTDLSTEEMLAATQSILKNIQQHEAQSTPLTFIAVKDITPEQAELAKPLKKAGYHTLNIDPSMVVKIRPHWHSVEDYLQEMSSKYRQRYRAARKKGKELQKHSLSADEIILHEKRLQELLDGVYENASFHLTKVPIESLVELKRSLGDSFRVTTYHHQDQIVGFSVVFCLDSSHTDLKPTQSTETSSLPLASMDTTEDVSAKPSLEAYLVGFDYEYNQSHKIYLNMLYDFVEWGIAAGVSHVHMGRTAWEIKSTVGAEPSYRITFIRHPGCLVNRFVSPLLGLVPPTDWTFRSPFKTDESPDSPESSET